MTLTCHGKPHWMQVFGCVEADPTRVHGRDWQAAYQTVDEALKARITPERLLEIESACRQRADIPSADMLMPGSGWGALELERRAQDKNAPPVPPSFVFPETTLGPEQHKWLGLLRDGYLKEKAPDDLPGEWMIQDEWFERLTQSLERDENRSWYAWLHADVMQLERFDEARAAAAWQHSIQLKPSAWAYRNLAVLAQRQQKNDDALECYDKAWKLVPGQPALVQEYLQALCAAGRYAKALAVYASLPEAIQQLDRLQILRGQIALGLNDLDTVEQVLQREYAVVRKGETVLTDLWFEMWLKRISAKTGRPPDEALRKKVEREYLPPRHIDFRSVNE